MKKSRTKTLIVAVSLIAFLVYLVLVIGINLKYPKAQLEEKQLGNNGNRCVFYESGRFF